jgi:hypothetical protein
MSLASDFAAAQGVSTAAQVVVTAATPTPFVGANGRADVTPDGNLKLTQTATGTFVLTPQQALAFAAWVQATFS